MAGPFRIGGRRARPGAARAAVAALALALCACGGPTRADIGRERVADVDALVAFVTRTHPEPFGAISEAEWLASVADVRERAVHMSDEEFLVAVARLANLGDRSGHGGVFPTDQPRLPMWPVRLYEFADGWRVVAAQDASLTGARVEAIGGHPVDEVAAALAPAVPRDNAHSLRARLATYLVTPAFLRGVGMYGALTVTDAAGARRDVTPREAPAGDYAALAGLDVPQIPPSLPRPAWAPPDDWFWLERRGGALVAGYERVVAEAQGGRRIQWLVAGIEEALAARRPAALVVDIRRNPGGDTGAARLLTILLRDVARAGRVPVRVLVSRATYSAAAIVFAELRAEAPGVTFYGEPSGGGSRTFGAPASTTLPGSGIVVQVAGAAASGAGPEVAALEPDVAVPVTWAAYAAGRDEVLDAASRR